MSLLFLLHLGATLAMMGVIWFVQIVHYPLFLHVGAANFPKYAQLHGERTGWVVAPLMLAEAGTALLLIWQRPTFVAEWEAWAGLILVGTLWLVTFGISVPLHERLRRGFDEAVGRRLTQTNWLRTAMWSARGCLVLIWASRAV